MNSIVFYEGAETASFSQEDKFAFFETMLKSGHSLKFSKTLPEESSEELVVGNWKEQVPSNLSVHNTEKLEASEVISQISPQEGSAKPWKPWFPVIDYDRCTNCMQCLNFCLFGVYGTSQEGKLQVKTAHNCKTDCPACSRVCPEAAIMFPKYKAGPINGDEVSEEDLNREKMKVDISSLLGGDIYTALRDRSAKNRSRFGKERDEDRALKERKKCLMKLKKELDIPDEVLNSLPQIGNLLPKTPEKES